jgi:hypothetical protein
MSKREKRSKVRPIEIKIPPVRVRVQAEENSDAHHYGRELIEVYAGNKVELVEKLRAIADVLAATKGPDAGKGGKVFVLRR